METGSGNVFTETSSMGWFGRIGRSFKGIVFGFVMFVVAFPLLFWNEGRAVRTAKTLEEGAAAVVSVSPEQPDPAHEGKLVHVTGDARTETALTDDTFGVSAKALRLRRTVELYQWHEKRESKTQKKLGGGEETTTTYTYDKKWSDDLVSSSEFKHPDGHVNPSAMPFESRTKDASPVTLGGFTLPASLVSQMGGFKQLDLPADAAAKLPADLASRVKLSDGRYFTGKPGDPQVGDARVTFLAVESGPFSVIARQNGPTFEPYTARTGGTIAFIQPGALSAEAMFAQQFRANTILTWVLRLVGFLLMTFGIAAIFAPLSVLADVVPFIGSLVGAGTFMVALGVAAVLSLTTISIAWLFYRPLLAIAILALAGAAAYGVSRLVKRRRPAAELVAA